MKASKFLVLATIPFIISSCNNKKSKPLECEVTAHMSATVNANKKEGYDVTLQYKDTYFDESSTKYSNEIKMISFGASLVTESQTQANQFFTTLQFDNFSYSGYGESTPDNVGYYIAHRTIKKYELIALTVRGFDYQKEWANNFEVGAEGNHQGFEARADEIMEALKTYVATYNKKTLKLWLSGYSRGGAISNVLANKLMTTNEIDVKKENLFVYTFNAPSCLANDNAVAYENVFNHISEMDLVAAVPPAQYGLKRCGQDITINKDKNVDQALLDFDKNAILPAFTPDASYYTSEKQLINYLINEILKDPGTAELSLNTRALYATNLQPYAAYVIGLYFSLPQTTVNKIMAKIQSLSGMGMLALFAEDGLYDLLKPILDEDHISYNDEQLRTSLNKVAAVAASKITLILSFIDTTTFSIKESVKNNFSRIIDMHTPEVVYALIK